jgi:hypothetical protein
MATPSSKFAAGQQIINWHTGVVRTVARARRYMPTVGWRYDTLAMSDLPLEDVNFYRLYAPNEWPQATFEVAPAPVVKTYKERRKLAELRKEVPHYLGTPRSEWKHTDHDPARVQFLLDYFLTRGEGRLYISSDAPEKLAAELGISPLHISRTVKGHAHKFDSVIKDSMALAGLDEELCMFFNTNGYRNGAFEIQLGYREFAELLLNRGVIPEGKGAKSAKAAC